ncbi:MAG: MATE family efflux transporter [Planctomycetes bacterium]|nr:MATE family efflux transporter [Planctomycetota bacterium]
MTEARDEPEISAIEPDVPIGAVAETEALAEASGTIQSGKLAGKSMWAAIWILALPVFVQQTMAAFVGMADKLFAGQLPAGVRLPALDAIGIGSYVVWFIGIAMAGLGIGGQALIARAMGAGNPAQAHRALGQAMSVSVAWGVLVAAALWLSAGPIAAACSLSSDATAYYMQYVRTLAWGMPFAGIMMVGAMCLHGAGETMRPSVIALGVNVVNVILSWILSGADLRYGSLADPSVLENPFAFDLHVRGIAAGTALSYAFGAAMTLIVLLRGVKDLRLQRRDIAWDPGMMRRIVRIGVPNFMEGISMWAVNLIVLMFIGIIEISSGQGEGLQGAHIIAVQWEAFSFLPGFAIGTAAGALAGQYLGAGNPRMAQRAVLCCCGLAAVVMGTFGVVFIVFGTELTTLISAEPIHLEHTPRLLMLGGFGQVFFAMAMVIRQGLRGVGDTRWTFVITTVSSYGVRMPAAYLLGVTLGLGIEGIWIGLVGEFAVRAALFAARFFHGGWKRLEV